MNRKLVFCFALLLSLSLIASSCATPTPTPAPAMEQPTAETAAQPTAMQAGGEVYFLNFKPEVADVYTQIAAAYKQETGVTLKVVTAASGTYEQTLRSEIVKADPPVLFQINGPIGYENWKDYCAELSGTELYKHLTDKSLAVTSNGGVYGIPYVVEGYGIIYNGAIMDKYFAMDGAVVTSMDAINNFATLKSVVEDMTAKKDQLGIQGVFSSTSLKPGEDWRWQTHLANIPIFYEIRDNNLNIANPNDFKTIKFEYSDEFKNIFDLYINNSTVAPTLLGSKSVDDSMAEFALGQSAMVQNGNWAWGQISGVQGNVVQAADVKFIPIYIGMPGEEKSSISVGTENYFAINSQASADKQKLAEDFIYWLYSSPTGKSFVTNQLQFIAPFDTFTAAERPTDPLALSLLSYTDNTSLYNVPWDFVIFPSQDFKNAFGGALLQYAQGQMAWPDVVQLFITTWASEEAKISNK